MKEKGSDDKRIVVACRRAAGGIFEWGVLDDALDAGAVGAISQTTVNWCVLP